MNSDYYERGREKQLARAYIPFQIMNQVFSASEALKKGTLFPELYMPYKKERMNLDGGGFYG
ncbi:spore coat associated protein CotJA [Clostridium sp. Cult1]|uniref:spore coat associated protein CotJA n=1 Tax=Clostridium sp. Cult1 TaxID=2079002 RepID=UPI001F246A11|nr:spore coat associated protein CotJA [Clostridium sp. Cult1]MCF6462295.1 spore coat associated protein CotJA [Clostridium sp. Cult1]